MADAVAATQLSDDAGHISSFSEVLRQIGKIFARKSGAEICSEVNCYLDDGWHDPTANASLSRLSPKVTGCIADRESIYRNQACEHQKIAPTARAP